MLPSDWDFESKVEEDKDHVARPEERVDRFGIRTALFVLCVAFFIVAMWLVSRPSFERCIALKNIAERNACFHTLRSEFLKLPTR